MLALAVSLPATAQLGAGIAAGLNNARADGQRDRELQIMNEREKREAELHRLQMDTLRRDMEEDARERQQRAAFARSQQRLALTMGLSGRCMAANGHNEAARPFCSCFAMKASEAMPADSDGPAMDRAFDAAVEQCSQRVAVE